MTSATSKTDAVRRTFRSAIGQKLTGYSTAEIQNQDGTWEAWPDLPIRLEYGGFTVSVAWSKLDDLWLANGDQLPFDVGGVATRWNHGVPEAFAHAVGATIKSVALGRGDMSLRGRDYEVWTRLVIETDVGWLEVFNSLDENGYDFHLEKPHGIFLPCG